MNMGVGTSWPMQTPESISVTRVHLNISHYHQAASGYPTPWTTQLQADLFGGMPSIALGWLGLKDATANLEFPTSLLVLQIRGWLDS